MREISGSFSRLAPEFFSPSRDYICLSATVSIVLETVVKRAIDLKSVVVSVPKSRVF